MKDGMEVIVNDFALDQVPTNIFDNKILVLFSIIRGISI